MLTTNDLNCEERKLICIKTIFSSYKKLMLVNKQNFKQRDIKIITNSTIKIIFFFFIFLYFKIKSFA